MDESESLPRMEIAKKDQLISSLADFILHLMSHLSEKFVNCYLVYKQLALQTRSNLTNGTCIVQKNQY